MSGLNPMAIHLIVAEICYAKPQMLSLWDHHYDSSPWNHECLFVPIHMVNVELSYDRKLVVLVENSGITTVHVIYPLGTMNSS